MGQSSSRQQRAASANPEPRAAPRRSVRKSLLNLIKPSSGSASRSSRRWSKAPVAEPVLSPKEEEEEVQEEVVDDAVNHGEAQQESHEQLDAQPTTSSNNDRPSLLLPPPSTPPVDVEPSPSPPTLTPSPNLDAPAPPNNTLGSIPEGQPQPTQAFPPPGTLVVVQGVVHTTDVPRSTSAATTTATPDQSLLSETSHDQERSPEAETVETQSEESAAPAQTGAAATTTTGQGPISSGSIDVLGTLLSVAAAATAASLLTGTSEPLHLPTAIDAPSSTPVSTESLRPSSPTPTSGLDPTRLRHAWGGIRERLGLRPQSTTRTPASTTATPPPSSNPFSPQVHEHVHEHTGAFTGDAREHLFGQMARAFNLGLGFAAESPSVPSPPSSQSHDSDQTSEPEEPAEGSFERFLIDLQTDLRTALTTPNPPSTPAPPAPAAFGPLTPSYTPLSSPSHTAASLPPLELITANNAGEVSAPATVSSSAASVSSASDHDTQDARDQNIEDHDDYADMPPLHEVSDTDDSDDAFDESDDEHDHEHGQAGPVSVTSGSVPEQVDVQGRINWWRLYRFAPLAVPPNVQVQGVPTTLGTAESTTTIPATHSSPTHTHSPSPAPEPGPDATLAELPFSTSSLPQQSSSAREQPQPHTVVPVIVVGVQSVSAFPPPSPPPDTASPSSPSPSPIPSPDAAPAFSSAPTSPAPPSASPSQQTPDPSRGWQTRAAEAIRSFHPHRRNNGNNSRPAAPGATSNGAGSRTFLIYVIGGYYPPNHSILNGGPDTLASLEALLELADLLGHTKPTTVTKEEIEKSGLETIKSTQLAQYEAEEKISSNCIERCLICLDDYQPEEDIRVMKCRHAFHQNCVDKWLETGRNNCPACRSKGVSLDGTAEVPG